MSFALVNRKGIINLKLTAYHLATHIDCPFVPYRDLLFFSGYPLTPDIPMDILRFSLILHSYILYIPQEISLILVTHPCALFYFIP